MTPTPRAVIVRNFARISNGDFLDGPHQGVFHRFSMDHEEFDEGPGNYPVAIIEWPDGKVDTVRVSLIQFVTPTVTSNSADAS
jgi:hypothetical protein